MRPEPENPLSSDRSTLLWEKKSKKNLPSPEDFLPVLQAWVAAHQGSKPRLNFYENSRHLTADELRQKDLKEGSQLYQEHVLARTLAYFMKKGVANKDTRQALAAIENLPTITHWQPIKESKLYDGFGNSLPTQYQLLQQLKNWSVAHGNTRPRTLFYQNGKTLHVEELAKFPHLYEEYELGHRFYYVLSKGHQPKELRAEFVAFNNLPVYHTAK